MQDINNKLHDLLEGLTSFFEHYCDQSADLLAATAAGFALSGVLVAVGYIISHAIEGEFTSWWTDIFGVITYIVVGLAILALMRVFTDKVILPKVNINDEIVKDKNIGAGLIEGTVYVLSAMLIAFFLT